jgi:protein-tyrosine phosphatase
MGATPQDRQAEPARSAEPFRLVFVCTANRCRSPMAEHLARRSLEKRHIPAEVCSVGRLKGGLGATPGAAEAMARRKLDLSDHVSAQLSPEVLADAHLVLVMERGHLSDVYQTLPDAIDHAFTLGEFPSLLRTTKGDPSLQSAASPARRRPAAHCAGQPGAGSGAHPDRRRELRRRRSDGPLGVALPAHRQAAGKPHRRLARRAVPLNADQSHCVR